MERLQGQFLAREYSKLRQTQHVCLTDRLNTDPTWGSGITFVVVCDFPENLLCLTVRMTLIKQITQHADLKKSSTFSLHIHAHSDPTVQTSGCVYCTFSLQRGQLIASSQDPCLQQAIRQGAAESKHINHQTVSTMMLLY